MFFDISIDPVFKKNTFQRRKMPLFLQFVQLNFQSLLSTSQPLNLWNALAFRTNTHKNGLIVFNRTRQEEKSNISQLVNAYNASMDLSGETFGGKCTTISTSAAVLSSIFLILILPFIIGFEDAINQM